MRMVLTICVMLAANLCGPSNTTAASATAEELARAKMEMTIAVLTDNYANAIPHLEVLARNNDALAQNILGSYYIKGLGVSKNVEYGAKLLQKSAEQGYVDSLFQLGVMTVVGLGVPADKVKGAELIKRSGDGGDKRAFSLLAQMYNEGEGVPKDATVAHMWANIGSAYGDQTCTQLRDSLEREMSRGEIAESNRMSRDWFGRHPQSEK